MVRENKSLLRRKLKKFLFATDFKSGTIHLQIPDIQDTLCMIKKDNPDLELSISDMKNYYFILEMKKKNLLKMCEKCDEVMKI